MPSASSCFFPCFSVSKKSNIKRSPNGMKSSKKLFLERKQYGRLGVHVRGSTRRPRGREARLPPWARPPPSWAPRSSPDRPLSPIYTHIPWKHHIRSHNPISTTTTLCTRDIPSWGLFRRSAGGSNDHGGLLHQHHSLSDDV